MNVDLPSVLVIMMGNDYVEKDGTPVSCINDKEDDINIDNYSEDDKEEDTKKLGTAPSLNKVDDEDDGSYFDVETRLYYEYGIDWTPKMPTFNITKLEGLDSDEDYCIISLVII